MSETAITMTLIFSLLIGLLFFLVLPHFLTLLLGRVTGFESLSDGQSAAFHAVDRLITLAFFLVYIWGISYIPDIRRVFQYHGAEHMAIQVYENGEPMSVASARQYMTLHPRCGTSFLLIVILMAMLIFLAIFPWLPTFTETRWLNQLILIAIKIPLMFPIAGLAYELQRLSARRYGKSAIVRALIAPGLWLQRITTQPPTDDQLEVALVSVQKVLHREAQGAAVPAGASPAGGALRELPGVRRSARSLATVPCGTRPPREMGMFQKLADVAETFDILEARLSSPEVAANPGLFTKLAKERAELEETVLAYRELQRIEQEQRESKALLEDESDPEMRALVREDLARLEVEHEKIVERLRVLLLPRDPLDDKNTILEIRAGTGGEEAGLFAADLFRMYSRFAERMRWKIEVLSQHGTGVGGLKEVICLITGKRVYSQLKFESGVHRVQRVPETESQGRIHTSACTVAVLPEAEEVD
jgi:uncharacterized protein YqhQ